MKKLKVFCSYSHKDAKLLDQLDGHMASLRRSLAVDTWTDGMIKAGSDWRKEIMTSLETADVILLLISSDFLRSDFCQSIELKRAIERHETDRTLIIPILLRPCDIKGTVLETFQCIPKGAKPVTEWANRDRAFVDIVDRIRAALSDFEPARAGAAAAPTANVQSTLKRVLGQSEFQSPLFFVTALQRARAVAWLTSRNGDPRRTGCLVRLSDFGLASAKDQMGILTTWQYGLGDSDDVGQAFFELAGFRTVLGEPVWRLPQWPGRVVGAQIFAVESVPADIEPCPLGDATKLQLNERVFVISHPLGGPLALSVRDTRLVAYEGFDVDYYAATELGSGGAPVFDDEWNIIAIHTRRIMPDGPKRGLSIREIRDAALNKSKTAE
jgi:hypothetical protein